MQENIQRNLLQFGKFTIVSCKVKQNNVFQSNFKNLQIYWMSNAKENIENTYKI